MTGFSLLTHRLPSEIEVNGRAYILDPRTTKALQCFMMSEETSIPIDVRIPTIVETMVPNFSSIPVEDMDEVYKAICGWLAGYPAQSRRKKSNKQLLSYEQDHAYIVASFRQAYGIGLAELKAMHWWEFLALLSGLPSDTKMAEIMSIRGTEISPKDTPEQRMAKIKAKTEVAIRPKKKETAKSGFDVISQALSEE